VTGVEVSTTLLNKEIHFVGLFIDPAAEGLGRLLRSMREDRDFRNARLLEKLRACGYRISMEEVLQVAGGESVGRPHIARILVEKGYFKSPKEVFERCLRRGCQAYEPRRLPSPKEALDAIHSAGGLAIWAHPVYKQPSERSYVRRSLKRLMPLGLDGIETRYALFSPGQVRMLEEMAVEHSLLQSGGSDYHGANQPGIELGTGKGDLRVPADFLLKLRAASLDREGARPSA
jgi:predicted metal-dependent phosphoesterase TrpH